MRLLCIFILLLTGCVNINVNHYSITYPEIVNEEKSEADEEKQAEENKAADTVPPVIVYNPKPVLPIEPPVSEPEEIKVSFLDIVDQFKQYAASYELNYFTPISIYEIYGVNELIVEEFVGGNRIIENEIVEAVVLKAKEGQADHVYQKVVQRQAFLLGQYPDSQIVKQAEIVRNRNWIIYSVLNDNQGLIDSMNHLINQT